jgi:acetate kinase
MGCHLKHLLRDWPARTISMSVIAMSDRLILVANPGSASRKYAVYDGERERAQLHFEYVYQKLVCTLVRGAEQHVLHLDFHDMRDAAGKVVGLLQQQNVLRQDESVTRVGLSVAAPSSFFLDDHIIDDDVLHRLQQVMSRSPLHIRATLEELHVLHQEFPGVPVVGVSDSAFHATKPDYAWNYGIPLDDADQHEIKRFGYNGLSAAAVVHELERQQKLPPKLVVCHLGSGASVTAIHGGKSIDTTMGYSPLEGVVMSTRSGSIDPIAVRTLKDIFRWDDNQVEKYLANHSGLLGLGGSADIRELLRREGDGDHRSRLALQTYIFSVHKAVGAMTAALGGVDALVFTGTVGERSPAIRERVAARLHFLDFITEPEANDACTAPEVLTIVSRLAHSKPIYVLPTLEAAELARRTLAAG